MDGPLGPAPSPQGVPVNLGPSTGHLWWEEPTSPVQAVHGHTVLYDTSVDMVHIGRDGSSAIFHKYS